MAKRVVLYACIFPYSLFFVGIYTESLFFLNLVACFYYSRLNEWGKASIFGILLTCTRLIGVAILPILLWEYMKQREYKLRKIDFKVLYIPLMSFGLLSYMTYLYFKFGDFFALFESSRSGFYRYFAWPWRSFIKHIDRIQDGTAMPIFNLEVFIVFLFIILCIIAIKYLRKQYVLLMVILFLVPVCSNTLTAIIRYTIVIFPMYIVLAEWGRNEKANQVIQIVSIALLSLFTILFANWVFIG